MQENSIHSTIKNIVWKYYNTRRSTGAFRDALNELALFLFECKGVDTDNLVHMVRCALGERVKYNAGILSTEEESILLDHYRETIEAILNSSFDGARGRSEFLQPKEVTEFASSFFKPEKEFSRPLLGGDPFCSSVFYNPFSGLGSYEMALPDYHFVGEEINPTIWALLQIRMHANGISSSISNTDFFSEKTEQKFKGIIATPPFGMTGERSVECIIERLYDSLEDKGQMVVVIPTGFLSSASRNSAQIKKRLLEDKAIDSVILLPEGLFQSTSVPVAVLVLEKSAHSSVLFVDASHAYRSVGKNRIFDAALLQELVDNQDSEAPVSVQLDTESLIERGCNLNPASIVSSEAVIQGRKLSSVAKVVPLTRVGQEVPNAPFFSPSELHRDFARIPIEVERLERRVIYPGRYYLIDRPCVIFDYKSTSDQVRVAYVETAPREPFYASASTVVLEPSDTISPLYLMIILSDRRVRRQLAAALSGAYIQRFNLDYVAEVRIPLHSVDEQERMVMAAMKSSMTTAEVEIEEAFAKYRKSVHSRKHALSQNVSALSALWNAFDAYRKGHGSISGDDLVGRKQSMTISDLCDNISRYLKTISAQTDAIADVKFDWGKIEWISIPEFVASYIWKHRSPYYTFIDLGRDPEEFRRFLAAIDKHGVIESLRKGSEPGFENVKFPWKALEHIVNNIVANAVAHGFSDKTRDDYKICFDWKEEDGTVVLYIANNGAPLHSELEPGAVLEYGASSALNDNGHSGLGGYEIASIMEQFRGSVEVLSTPNEEYTVTYKLVFTQVSRYLPEDEID